MWFSVPMRYSTSAIDAHESAALVAFSWAQLAGLLAWLALWQGRRLPRPPRLTVAAVLVLAVLTVALMANAATIGGEVRHPEIVITPTAAAAAVVAPVGWVTSRAVGTLVVDTPWIWPAAETLHFIGLSLIFGVLLAVNLRILGAMKEVPFAALHRLLPWGILGFALNFVTGMLFFIAAASQYLNSFVFYWKIAFLMVAGAQFLYLTVSNRTWMLHQGQAAPALDKVIAVVGIGAWAGVIYWGRMLPFLGKAF